ncbi:transposase, partial [Streptomyces sp. M2CJ-2]|uniref:RNA-guided endonuclease InsQ/TnpB family protein n=1 Tax=Streptomyces sp. M2CJ-2 TaxID=2803948 RepID=UPI0019293776
WTRDLPVGRRADKNNRITGARLVKDASPSSRLRSSRGGPIGRHIAFRVQTLQPEPGTHTGPEVGIDAGVNLPPALSDGRHFDHGRPARLADDTADRDKWLTGKEKARLLRLERRAAHRKNFRKPQERTSNRLRTTYDQIRRLRATATRRAVDRQHKTTTEIADRDGTVVVEQLTITNMVRSARGSIEQPGRNVSQKAGLDRSISQEAWGRTVTMLTYKLARRGGTLVKVPAAGASRRCSACGLTTPR